MRRINFDDLLSLQHHPLHTTTSAAAGSGSGGGAAAAATAEPTYEVGKKGHTSVIKVSYPTLPAAAAAADTQPPVVTFPPDDEENANTVQPPVPFPRSSR